MTHSTAKCVKDYDTLTLQDMLNDWQHSTGSFDTNKEDLLQYEAIINNLIVLGGEEEEC
tara:strand:+ start:48 stop:224 length:177 start_codon:yes stop_codon:yes gene_type:complete